MSVVENLERLNKPRHRKSNIFFVLSSIFMILTIICFCFEQYFSKNIVYKEMDKYYYGKLQYESKYPLISKAEYEELEDKYKYVDSIDNIIFYSGFAVGGITIVFLILGIIFKIKEKGGIEIVN